MDPIEVRTGSSVRVYYDYDESALSQYVESMVTLDEVLLFRKSIQSNIDWALWQLVHCQNGRDDFKKGLLQSPITGDDVAGWYFDSEFWLAE